MATLPHRRNNEGSNCPSDAIFTDSLSWLPPLVPGGAASWPAGSH